ncbi:MAG: hypothetical protein M1833_002217 [Piccolia ochrophora]|nr:MAG: hypothetical protein M1833_002217 [Piccolia ochrophora]
MVGNSASGATHAEDNSNYIVPLFINGKEIVSDVTFDVTSPSSNEVVWKASSASEDGVKQAVDAAQAALPAWSRTKPAHRRDIFFRAAEIMERRGKEIAGYMQTETGAEAGFALGFNIPTSVEMIRDIGGRIPSIQGSIPFAAAEGTSALVYKEPYGVILGIAPWNAPLILGVRAVAYALATGNTVILKGSELSPRTFWGISSVFAEAGLPAGAFNLLMHRPQDAAQITTALIAHPAVRKINFTGSTAVGSIIAQTAAKHVKPVLMELGGKASTLVLDDADIQLAAKGSALGAFLHTGQVCMSTERIVVHASIAKEFATALRATIDEIFGSGDAPILVSAAGKEKTKKLVDSALASGAKLLSDRMNTEDTSKTRMRPVVVENVTKDMDLYYTESFGPSVSLITVQSDEEAVEVANDTEYGLSAAVFTKDLARGLRVAKQIESGAVHINSMTVHDEPMLPHGGAKKSGYGRFNGHWGFEEFLRIKTVTFQE